VNNYQYLNPINKGVIKIIDVELPEGPIKFKRWNPSKGEGEKSVKAENISAEMLWRIANAFRPNQPINVDRIFGGSYNTRSVLETLLAHTPQFYFCYPGRIEKKGQKTSIKKGHKHLMWQPEQPHKAGFTEEAKTEIVISEVPTMEAFYDSLVIPDEQNINVLDIDLKRRHAQIQIALYFIGKQLGFRTWIAQNDKGIIYQNKRIAEFDGVINSLEEVKLVSAYSDAIKAALLIDCIWFKNGKLMPAVMEVEHSTGVTSGLSRMKNFQDRFPPFPTRYVIVADDNEREKVLKESNKEQFRGLDAKFFSYSSVEELYALCQRRKLRGVTDEFLDCYMESMLLN
jgi:type II restriction enzyme